MSEASRPWAAQNQAPQDPWGAQPGYPQQAPAAQGYPPPAAYPQGYPPQAAYPQQASYPPPGYPPQQVATPPGYPQQNFAPPPGYPQPQPAYAGYPAQVQQGPDGGPAGGMLRCRICGCGPAAAVTFRGHQGMVFIMRFLSVKGPFCRDCGLATFRDLTSRTLVQGWWGYASSVITPFTVLINLLRRGRVARLDPPQPAPYATSRPPLDPGDPLYARPMAIIGAAIPVVLALVLVIVATSNH